MTSVTPTMGNDSQANKVAAASVMWGQLSEEQKQPFLEAAEADRQAYRKELEAYSQTAAFAEYQKKKSEWMKSKHNKAHFMSGAFARLDTTSQPFASSTFVWQGRPSTSY